MYAPSLFELEWNAFVIVKRTSSTATVPPLFGSRTFSRALGSEPIGELDRARRPCTVLLRERDGVADVVAVPVRDRDHVDALGRLLVLGALRIPVEERVDVDALAGRVEAEGGVSEPREFHGPSLNVKDRPMRTRTFRAWVRGSCPWRSRRPLLRLERWTSAGLALWLGLFAIPAAAAAAFVAVSDVLEGESALIYAATSSLALSFIVLACAVRSNAVAGTGAPPLATWALLVALLAYSAPAVAWFFEPVKVTRTRPDRRRRRPAPVVETAEFLEEAA